MEFEKGSQLKGYIQKEIKDQKIHSNYGYTYYFCRKFLEQLFNNSQNFVLKGSFSQFANLGKISRPLTDIDMAVLSDMEFANNMIISLTSHTDIIKYTIKQQFITTNATINYRLLCELDNIQHLITIDLRKENDLDIVNKPLPKLFSKDQSFSVGAISLEEHLANKLYIALLNLELNLKLGKEFRRIKDFYDIHTILSYGSFDERKVSELLNLRIKSDEFLNSYSLLGNLFDKEFLLDQQDSWNVNSQKYNFQDQVAFQETVEETNDLLSRMR
ncbi:MAG: nucleotidyl transferase AbiEii/AbiGii toxin family protein [Mollicutes bacterium]|nr:nucleotidyl transferase AbiEii/AbiGii toxin family protein [Mollicutes bacterium]